MDSNDRLDRIAIKNKFRDECQRNLRAQELNAYSELMSAIRMSGKVTEPKQQFIDTLQKWFNIPPWRHRAELRRVAMDERLTEVADTLSGDYTREEWMCSGILKKEPITSKKISLFGNEQIIMDLVNRRLRELGVDLSNDEESDIDAESGKPKVHESISALASEIHAKMSRMRPEGPSILEGDKIEIELRAMERLPSDSDATYISNLSDDDYYSSSDERNRRRRYSSDNRSVSPDISNFSESQLKRYSTMVALRERVSHSSDADMERAREKLERDTLRLLNSSSIKEETKALLLKEETTRLDKRSERETSAVSSASSYMSSSETTKEIKAIMAKKAENREVPPSLPPPLIRGRGSSRGGRPRGIAGATTGRGRGRGRGRWPAHLMPDNYRSYGNDGSYSSSSFYNSESSVNEQHIKEASTSNGAIDVKKRPIKRKKSELSSSVQEESMDQTNRTSFPAQFPGVTSSPSFPQFSGSFNNPGNLPPSRLTSPQKSNSSPSAAFNQSPEPPAKLRHKTKHTLVFQEHHESIPSPVRTGTNFGDKDSNFQRSTISTVPPPTSLNSVIVKTPPQTSHTSPNTPPKSVINTIGIPPKTHITITQSVKSSPPNFPGVKRELYGHNDNLSPISQSQSPAYFHTRNSNSPNNMTYKKRTQNLSAGMTYTPQHAHGRGSDGNKSPALELQPSLQGGSGTAGTLPVAATASSLAARIRPVSDSKSTIPVTSPMTPRGPPALTTTSVSRPVPVLSSSSSSTPTVHQRKAQPHILATSKLHRNATAVAAAINSVTSPQTASNTGVIAVTSTSPSSLIPNTTMAITTSSSSPNLTSSTLGVTAPLQIPTLSPPTNAALSSILPPKTIPATASPSVRTPATNIILVQKNPASPLTPAISSTNTELGGMVKAPGKAVIVRHANNNKLMILDLQKNQFMSASPVGTQLVHGARLGPQVVNAGSVTAPGSPIRRIIHTSSGKVITSSILAPNPSPTSTIIARPPHIFTRSLTTPVPPVSLINQSLDIPQLAKPQSLLSAKLVGVGNMPFVKPNEEHQQRADDKKEAQTILENEIKYTCFLNKSTSSTDTASETSDITTTLLSNEVMENSPPTFHEDELEMNHISALEIHQLSEPSSPLLEHSNPAIPVISESQGVFPLGDDATEESSISSLLEDEEADERQDEAMYESESYEDDEQYQSRKDYGDEDSEDEAEEEEESSEIDDEEDEGEIELIDLAEDEEAPQP